MWYFFTVRISLHAAEFRELGIRNVALLRQSLCCFCLYSVSLCRFTLTCQKRRKLHEQKQKSPYFKPQNGLNVKTANVGTQLKNGLI